MAVNDTAPAALSDSAARQLANATKTVPQLETISPRWLAHLLHWVPVEAGIYRLNKVKHPEAVDVVCPQLRRVPAADNLRRLRGEPARVLPQLGVTRCSTCTPASPTSTRSPHDQIKEQLRLTIETIKEHQESELINNPNYGLLANVRPAADPDAGRPADARRPRRADHQGVEGAGLLPGPSRSRSPRSAANAPGAACRRRRSACSARSSSPGAACRSSRRTRCRSENGKTKILLLRAGEARQGVVGLFQPGLAGEQSPGLSVRFMGIDRSAIASYLVSLYCSLAVLTDDALAVLDDVEVGKFHDYGVKYAK